MYDRHGRAPIEALAEYMNGWTSHVSYLRWLRRCVCRASRRNERWQRGVVVGDAGPSDMYRTRTGHWVVLGERSMGRGLCFRFKFGHYIIIVVEWLRAQARAMHTMFNALGCLIAASSWSHRHRLLVADVYTPSSPLIIYLLSIDPPWAQLHMTENWLYLVTIARRLHVDSLILKPIIDLSITQIQGDPYWDWLQPQPVIVSVQLLGNHIDSKHLCCINQRRVPHSAQEVLLTNKHAVGKTGLCYIRTDSWRIPVTRVPFNMYLNRPLTGLQRSTEHL